MTCLYTYYYRLRLIDDELPDVIELELPDVIYKKNQESETLAA
jgi:hypothetical protein